MGHPLGWPVLPRLALRRASGFEGRGGCSCQFTNDPAVQPTRTGPIRNCPPLIPVRWVHKYSLECILETSRFVDPFLKLRCVACGPPQPARPTPCTPVPQASHTNRCVFRRVSVPGKFLEAASRSRGMCPVKDLSNFPPGCCPHLHVFWQSSSVTLVYKLTLVTADVWVRKPRLNVAGKCSNLCCSKTVWINVI